MEVERPRGRVPVGTQDGAELLQSLKDRVAVEEEPAGRLGHVHSSVQVGQCGLSECRGTLGWQVAQRRWADPVS